MPAPIDTSEVVIPAEVVELRELLARNMHEVWAWSRMAQGWRYGPQRDDERKEHPDLVPYEKLDNPERAYDRRSAMETLKVIISLGYRILPPPDN